MTYKTKDGKEIHLEESSPMMKIFLLVSKKESWNSFSRETNREIFEIILDGESQIRLNPSNRV